MSKSVILKDKNGENIFPYPYYPIGSIYISINNINPSTYFEGKWERIAKGKTLVGVDEDDSDFSSSRKTGGEKTHKLTIDEMPSHNHATSVWNYYNGDMSVGEKIARTMDAADGGNTIYTSSAGGDKEHNNLQPYFTVYIWLRVA